MTENEFNQLIDEAIATIIEALDNAGQAIDYESDDDDTLTLFFDNSSEIHIENDSDKNQIVISSDSGKYTFEYDADAEQWLCDGVDIMRILSRECTEQAGEVVNLQI